MKTTVLKSILFALCLFASGVAHAYDFKVDSLYYTITSSDDKTVEVADCSSKTSGALSIPSSVTYNSTKYSVTSIGKSAFKDCSGLTSITIPSSVTSIGYRAFYECRGLTSITIPSSVTSIGDDAFSDCSGLTSINVNSSNKNYCSVDGVLFSKDKKTIIRYPQGKDDSAYIIPSSVTSIGNSAFCSCSWLTITIPSSVTSIGEGAFCYCRISSIPSSVKSIGSSAFDYCEVSSLTFTSELGTEQYAFTSTIIDTINIIGCPALCHLTFSSCGVKVVNVVGSDEYDVSGHFSHYYFSGFINSFNVASSNKYYCSIDGVLFSKDKKTLLYYPNGKSDKEYIIPSGVTSIGPDAFCRCDGLTSITIPSSVMSIKDYAFYYCSMTSVTSLIKEPFEIESSIFYGSSKQTLYVPKKSLEAYKSTKYWSSFKNILPLPGNYLCAPDTSGRRGSQMVLPIELENDSLIRAFQFDLVLPKGITVSAAKLASRASDLTLSYRQKTDTTYIFVVADLALTGTLISEGEGAVLNLTLDISSDVEEGTYPVKIQNYVLSTEDYDELTNEETVSMLTVEDFLLGDVNANGEVNVNDAALTVSHILQQELEIFIERAADMNGNGTINVNDVSLIVSVIMGDETSSAKPQLGFAEETAATDQLTCTATANNGYEIALENNKAYTSFQMDVTLSEGQALKHASLTTRRGDHVLQYNKVGDHRYRLVCYSATNDLFVGSGGAIVNLETTGGDVTVSDILFVTDDLRGVTFDALQGTATGITTLQTEENSTDSYDLSGRKLGTTPQKGIMIKNGKKIINK